MPSPEAIGSHRRKAAGYSEQLPAIIQLDVKMSLLDFFTTFTISIKDRKGWRVEDVLVPSGQDW